MDLIMVAILGLCVLLIMSSIKIAAVVWAADNIRWTLMVTGLGICLRFKDNTTGRLYVGPIVVKKISLLPQRHQVSKSSTGFAWSKLQLSVPSCSIIEQRWKNRIAICWHYLKAVSISCSGCLQVGFPDPSMTGILCAVINVVTPTVNAERLQLLPNFCCAEFKGRVTVRCSANIGVLLWLSLKLSMIYIYRQVKYYIWGRYWENEFCR